MISTVLILEILKWLKLNSLLERWGATDWHGSSRLFRPSKWNNKIGIKYRKIKKLCKKETMYYCMIINWIFYPEGAVEGGEIQIGCYKKTKSTLLSLGNY